MLRVNNEEADVDEPDNSEMISLPISSGSSSYSRLSEVSSDSGISINRSSTTLVDAIAFQQFLVSQANGEDLRTVEAIDLNDENAQFSTIANLGHFLPNLKKVNVSGYPLPSIRDLGSALENLRILNIDRCQMTSLDGIMCLPHLEELYAASNAIEDIGPCAFASQIKVIDLQKNKIRDVHTVSFLSLCCELKDISLSECPVSRIPDYRQVIKYLLPQIIYLDGRPFMTGGSGSMSLSSSSDQGNQSETSGVKSERPPDVTYILRNNRMKLAPKLIQRNVVHLPPIASKNAKLPSIVDCRPATTNSIPDSTSAEKSKLIDRRPASSRNFNETDFTADLETIKQQLKNLPALCNPFTDSENSVKEKELQTEETSKSLLASAVKWRVRSASYRSLHS